MRLFLLALVVLGLCSGCTTLKPARLQPLPEGAKLQLRVSGVNDDVGVFGSEKLGTQIIAGTGEGALLGFGAGMVSGLSCGPMFIICSPLGGVVAAGAGAVFGAVVGGVDNTLRRVPAEDVVLINAHLAATLIEGYPVHSLTCGLREEATRFMIVEDGADYVLVAHIEQVHLEQFDTGELALKLGVVFKVLVMGGEYRLQEQYVVQGLGKRRPVSDWRSLQVLQNEIDALSTSLSHQVMWVLADPPA